MPVSNFAVYCPRFLRKSSRSETILSAASLPTLKVCSQWGHVTAPPNNTASIGSLNGSLQSGQGVTFSAFCPLAFLIISSRNSRSNLHIYLPFGFSFVKKGLGLPFPTDKAQSRPKPFSATYLLHGFNDSRVREFLRNPRTDESSGPRATYASSLATRAFALCHIHHPLSTRIRQRTKTSVM